MIEIEKVKAMRKWKFSWRIFGENFVFFHEWDYYKMPTALAKNTIYKRVDSYEKVCSSHEIIEKYFWKITKIPETEVEKDGNKDYIIKQKSIDGKKLQKKDLENNPKLLSKFKRLIIANEVMRRNEWVFLDLLGSDIVAHPQTIHNLLTDGKDIYVFDFGLLERTSDNTFFRYLSHFVQRWQLLFVKWFF